MSEPAFVRPRKHIFDGPTQLNRGLRPRSHSGTQNSATSLRAGEGTRGTPDVEVRLREQIAKLKKTVANKDKELTRLRSDVPALVRVIDQIPAENAELRETLKMPPANIVPCLGVQVPVQSQVRPDVKSDDRHP